MVKPVVFTETNQKKISEDEISDVAKLEKKVHDILELSITLINNRFHPLRGKFSPQVAVMQNVMEIYPEKKYKEKELENNGFINVHFCINAATEMEHTEHDSSYTVIMVPNQDNSSTANGIHAPGRFELVINKSTTMLINMYPGIMFTYSGYMLTHRQQLNRNLKESEDFVNIISYNSKRLFCNIIESFRRDIQEDKKPNLKKLKFSIII